MVTSIFFRRFTHPWMAMALYIPLGLLFSGWALGGGGLSASRFSVLLVLGLFAWTLIEYGLHRFVFHWTEVREPWRTVASGLHRAHHGSASSADLIVAPPVASLGFGSLVYLLFALMTWSFRDAAVLETGVFTGYLAYEWVHFMSHRFQPKTALGKSLRKYHLQHHFRNDDRQFGVTNPFWDIVFGTYRSRSVALPGDLGYHAPHDSKISLDLLGQHVRGTGP